MPGREHLQRRVKAVLRTAKTRSPSLKGTPLADNLARLGAKLGLSALEQEIAAIAVLLQGYRPFSGVVGAPCLVATARRNGSVPDYDPPPPPRCR